MKEFVHPVWIQRPKFSNTLLDFLWSVSALLNEVVLPLLMRQRPVGPSFNISQQVDFLWMGLAFQRNVTAPLKSDILFASRVRSHYFDIWCQSIQQVVFGGVYKAHWQSTVQPITGFPPLLRDQDRPVVAHCCAIFLCHLGCDRHQQPISNIREAII